jgi:hypothetical protein
MARTRETTPKSTRGPPHLIQHPQAVPEQEEPVQPEDAPEFMEVDDDDNYYDYYGAGWVDTDAEEEPMELLKDHPDAVEDSKKEDAAGGDGADPDSAGGDDAEDGGDDLAALDGGDDDPDDDPEPATAVDVPPPEPHFEKQIHHLDFVEGLFPVLLWRAMQRIGFPLMPRYEASLLKNAQQEEWLVALVISVPDERYGSRMEYYKHFADVPRNSLDAGTSEATRRALYYLYHAYWDELQGTEFQQFPRRRKGATSA